MRSPAGFDNLRSRLDSRRLPGFFVCIKKPGLASGLGLQLLTQSTISMQRALTERGTHAILFAKPHQAYHFIFHETVKRVGQA